MIAQATKITPRIRFFSIFGLAIMTHGKALRLNLYRADAGVSTYRNIGGLVFFILERRKPKSYRTA